MTLPGYASAGGDLDALQERGAAGVDAREQALPRQAVGPGDAPWEAPGPRRDERWEADETIRWIHDYCAGWCPRREACPGEACRLYRREQEAKGTLMRLDADEQWDPEVGPGGVILEQTIR